MCFVWITVEHTYYNYWELSGKYITRQSWEVKLSTIPYKNKYWQGTKFGESANCHTIAKFKSPQYFFYSILFMTLDDFAKLISHQIHIFNKSPNIISTNIYSYTVFVMRLSPSAVYFIQIKWQCFKWFIVFFIY